MRKYIIGFMAGVILTFASSAYGAELVSMVGKKVQGEANVSVDGVDVGQIVIIEGKSYAPVRAIGESAGYSISLNGKNVILERPSNSDITGGSTVTEAQLSASLTSLKKEKETLLKEIEMYTIRLNDPKFAANKSTTQLAIEVAQKQLKAVEEKIADREALLEEIQSQ